MVGPTKVLSRFTQNLLFIESCFLPVYGPSGLSFREGSFPDPKEMTESDINKVINAFVESAGRAEKAGCE